jgi:hypothetical protein
MKKILSLIIISTIYSCGNGSPLPEPNEIAREELNLVALEGSWSGCRQNGANSFQTTLSANNNTTSTTIDFYNGVTDCSTTSSFTTRKTGVFSIAQTGSSVTGFSGSSVTAFNFDITVTEFSMRSNSPAITIAWNASSVCGKNDWSTGAFTSVINLVNCDPSLSGNHPDEISNGIVTNLISSPTNSTVSLNVQVSSNGTVTTRPLELSSTNPFSVSLTKQ